MSSNYLSDSEAQTMAFAADLASRLRPGDVLALEGPLGAGKTCFVRGLARGLGIDPGQVSSPTFVICQEYERRNGTLTLIHIDAYRLSGPDELETIGWEDLLAAPAAVMAIEWPDRISSALPADRTIHIRLEHEAEQQRRITVDRPERTAAGKADHQ